MLYRQSQNHYYITNLSLFVHTYTEIDAKSCLLWAKHCTRCYMHYFFCLFCKSLCHRRDTNLWRNFPEAKLLVYYYVICLYQCLQLYWCTPGGSLRNISESAQAGLDGGFLYGPTQKVRNMPEEMKTQQERTLQTIPHQTTRWTTQETLSDLATWQSF